MDYEEEQSMDDDGFGMSEGSEEEEPLDPLEEGSEDDDFGIDDPDDNYH
ncbi:MAG TPA: hypothetical protein VG694_01725 [Candidatus Paceibacterota bacterium]|jgi:hypothetical protein|nr:hypothetical protein [Candidatus Paceibacterota bacterium]